MSPLTGQYHFSYLSRTLLVRLQMNTVFLATMEILIVLLVEGRSQECHWNKNFWRPHGQMGYCRNLYFCAIKPLTSQGPISLHPVKKKGPISFSAGIRSKPVSQVPVPCLHSTIQHKASLICVPICSAIGSMAIQDAWTSIREPQVS